MDLPIKIKRLCPDAKLPTRAHANDAGLDLYAAEDAVLYEDDPTLVKCGFSLEIPAGLHAEIRSRSGLALKQGIVVYNAPGTIDSDYRGEVGVILCWNGFMAEDGLIFQRKISKGDRIAQMVIMNHVHAELVEVDETSDTERGEGGFGSSGR